MEFETLTYAAALAGVTERIALFSTVHVPMVHPVFAAKALTTVDHASGGRAGLNIVCGWSPEEFELFGLPMIEDRYAQGLEWVEIVERIYAGGPPFDYDGRFLSTEERVRAAAAGAAAASGDAERRVFPGGTRLCGPDRGFPVHHVRRYREWSGAYRRHVCTCRTPRAVRWVSIPPATWCAGRRRPRRRIITSITRCRMEDTRERGFLHGGEGEVLLIA